MCGVDEITEMFLLHPRHRASRGKSHDRSGSYLNRRIGRKTRGEIKQAEAIRDDDDLQERERRNPARLPPDQGHARGG